MLKRILLSVSISLFLLSANSAQEKNDSIKTYRIEDITVKGALLLEPESFFKIEPKSIKRADAMSLFDLGKNIPSIKIQTNSRGESLFFLRGAGERQITLFLDGISLNIPWDNRIDLSLIPAEAIEEITVLKGTPPAVFGANAVLGVINLSTINPETNSKNGRFSFQIGESGNKMIAGSYWRSEKDFSFVLSANYRSTNSYKLPNSFYNSFNPTKERLNSFIETSNLLGKLNYKWSDQLNTELIISYSNSEKGVPPEIGVANPRYWIYPLWKNFTMASNGNLKFNNNQSNLFYSFSLNNFRMEIDQYKDPNFSQIEDIEKNYDRVFRSRLILTHIFNDVSLVKVALNSQFFNHQEEFLSSNFVSQTYAENIFSGGVEYEFVKNNYVLSLGGGIDFVSTPKTGDKPSRESVSDFALNAAFVYSVAKNLSVRLNGGRKTRFPTLRETFSGALGRFVPNPSLKAEVTYSSELSITYKNSGLDVDAAIFLNYLNDGIVRISLPKKQFQRINKDQIRTYGVELISSFKYDDFFISVNSALLSAKSKSSTGEFTDTLEYRPQFNFDAVAEYFLTNNLSAAVEFEYIAMEYGLNEGSSGFQKIPEYLLTNLRLAYGFIVENINAEIYLRVNNLFDKLYYSQYGLPEAGRQIFIGLKSDF